MTKVNEVQAILPERIFVGLSSIIGVSVGNFQSEVKVKILAGGGTLEIGGTYVLTAGPNGTTTLFTWTNGYLLGATEVLSFNCQGNFYLAATGATMTVAIFRGLGPGANGP